MTPKHGQFNQEFSPFLAILSKLIPAFHVPLLHRSCMIIHLSTEFVTASIGGSTCSNTRPAEKTYTWHVQSAYTVCERVEKEMEIIYAFSLYFYPI